MSTLPDTIYLNPATWDLDIDSKQCIAIANTPYAQAQNVASSCRTWLGECALNEVVGVPYEQAILGLRPTATQLSGWYTTAAEITEGVETATPILTFNQATRQLGGQIQLTLEDGNVTNVSV